MMCSSLVLLLLISTVSEAHLINPGTPYGVTSSFDCAVRQYAYEYGQQIQSRHGSFVTLFDSLQLAACNYTRPQETPRKIPNYKTSTTKDDTVELNNNSCTFYVDPIHGSDSNSGESPDNAFLSIETGIDATRKRKMNSNNKSPFGCTLNLMQGTFYLNATIILNTQDSYLTIQNYNESNTTISGGLPLEFKNDWKLYKYEATTWKKYDNYNNVYNRADPDSSNDLTIYLGVEQSYNNCLTTVTQATPEKGGPFRSFTWHSLNFSQDYSGHCYGVRDFSWQPVIETGVYSGRLTGLNIFSNVVSNSKSFADGKLYGLRVNDERGIRARFPDQIPEIGMQYNPLSGWIQYDTKWIDPIPTPEASNIIITGQDIAGNVTWPMNGPGNTTWTGEGDWGDFWMGIGGPCETSNKLAGVDPPYGYWCSANAPRDIMYHTCPSGVYLDSTTIVPNAPYSNITGAVVHSWRPSHWFTWMWECDDSSYVKNASSDGKVLFSKGGFQGGEGETSGAEWYISNVFEELSMPNEYFYNESTNTLYYYYNSTDNSSIPSNTSFIGTNLNILFNITGTQSNPVKNITIRGLTFRDTRYTFLDSHGLPSGGDWALQRQGALFLQGTENCTIDSNLFTRLDGIGLFLSNYNRYTYILNNDFEWIGDSAMAAWGYTTGLEDILPGMGPDGRDGNQPRFTFIKNNMIREIGIWEKQSSFWFQAQTCQSYIINNIFFNGPRAGVNVNDGFGGDNHMIGNLLVNTCRESGDHGPWNSWDRVPYITNVGGKGSSIIPQWNYIHNNFIIGTYQTTVGIDTDDGTSYHKTYDNFFVYGQFAFKSDFGGHDNRHFSNIYAYTSDWYCYYGSAGANDWFVNNSLILTDNTGYTSNCDLPAGTSGFKVYNNSIYLPKGNLTVCNMTFEQWQSKGNDPGTTIHKLPTDDDIIAMAKEKLKNNSMYT